MTVHASEEMAEDQRLAAWTDLNNVMVRTQGLGPARQQDDAFRRDCPTRTVLDHVMSRWGALVLVTLGAGTLRFSQLRRRIDGVSEQMLAQTLQTLERDGFVHREGHPVIPRHVEHRLTRRGVELVGRLVPLLEWVHAHAVSILSGRPHPDGRDRA